MEINTDEGARVSTTGSAQTLPMTEDEKKAISEKPKIKFGFGK